MPPIFQSLGRFLFNVHKKSDLGWRALTRWQSSTFSEKTDPSKREDSTPFWTLCDTWNLNPICKGVAGHSGPEDVVPNTGGHIKNGQSVLVRYQGYRILRIQPSGGRNVKSSARMVVGSSTLVAPSRSRIPIQVYMSAANISRQMDKSVVEETVSVRTRLALQSPRPASSRRVELYRSPWRPMTRISGRSSLTAGQGQRTAVLPFRPWPFTEFGRKIFVVKSQGSKEVLVVDMRSTSKWCAAISWPSWLRAKPGNQVSLCCGGALQNNRGSLHHIGTDLQWSSSALRFGPSRLRVHRRDSGNQWNWCAHNAFHQWVSCEVRLLRNVLFLSWISVEGHFSGSTSHHRHACTSFEISVSFHLQAQGSVIERVTFASVALSRGLSGTIRECRSSSLRLVHHAPLEFDVWLRGVTSLADARCSGCSSGNVLEGTVTCTFSISPFPAWFYIHHHRLAGFCGGPRLVRDSSRCTALLGRVSFSVSEVWALRSPHAVAIVLVWDTFLQNRMWYWTRQVGCDDMPERRLKQSTLSRICCSPRGRSLFTVAQLFSLHSRRVVSLVARVSSVFSIVGLRSWFGQCFGSCADRCARVGKPAQRWIRRSEWTRHDRFSYFPFRPPSRTAFTLAGPTSAELGELYSLRRFALRFVLWSDNLGFRERSVAGCVTAASESVQALFARVWWCEIRSGCVAMKCVSLTVPPWKERQQRGSIEIMVTLRMTKSTCSEGSCLQRHHSRAQRLL